MVTITITDEINDVVVEESVINVTNTIIDYAIISEFTGLTDTPDNYSGHAGKTVKVNSSETALEFVTDTSSLTTKHENFTLTSGDITNKYIQIMGTITDNQSFRVFLDNIGIKLEQGIDYSISGNQIFWTGYQLEVLLEVGDKLKFFYV